MRFTLIYRGPLPANGDARSKHAVRRQLHPQLKHLFTYPPLNHRVNTMLDEVQTLRPSIIERLGGRAAERVRGRLPARRVSVAEDFEFWPLAIGC